MNTTLSLVGSDSAPITVSLVLTGPITTTVISAGITGPAGPVGPEGLPGSNGINGVSGANGADATISIGTVTTAAAGSNATVTNSGTPSAAVFDISIPRGATGAAGQTGAPGASGPQGPAGTAATVAVGTVTTGAPGSSASVTNSGTATDAVLEISIPRGAAGATGATGAAGTAATVAIGTVTTGAAGSSATVTNSGTANAAVLDIAIPRGATGAPGANGSTGPAGVSAVTHTATGTIDFGSTDSGDASIFVAATWAGTIPHTINIESHPSDHDPEDVLIEQVWVSAVASSGTGFNIYAHAPNGTWGRYNITILGYS